MSCAFGAMRTRHGLPRLLVATGLISLALLWHINSQKHDNSRQVPRHPAQSMPIPLSTSSPTVQPNTRRWWPQSPPPQSPPLQSPPQFASPPPPYLSPTPPGGAEPEDYDYDWDDDDDSPSPPPPSASPPPNQMHASAADRLLVAASATKTLPWYVEGEESKAGAGVLLFAYGRRQLNHFLLEAQDAALTFRRHNPRLKIAIVTNNATVNPEIFSRHINPRSDLLFAGDLSNGGQNRTDGWPRQWLTRLYYMAHSPFEITWALDSNVGTCTPGAAQAFLDAALQTKLWGYDVAQASQSVLVMYPHNWNIVFRWSPVVSSLMRDWFLLQLRRGVAHAGCEGSGTLRRAPGRRNGSYSCSRGQDVPRMRLFRALQDVRVSRKREPLRLTSGEAVQIHQ